MQKAELQAADPALVAKPDEKFRPRLRLKNVRKANDQERDSNECFDSDLHPRQLYGQRCPWQTTPRLQQRHLQVGGCGNGETDSNADQANRFTGAGERFAE